MTTLPLISHHLFVAAIENGDGPRLTPARKEVSSFGLARPVAAIPLEVITSRKSLPVQAARPLPASPTPGGP